MIYTLARKSKENCLRVWALEIQTELLWLEEVKDKKTIMWEDVLFVLNVIEPLFSSDLFPTIGVSVYRLQMKCSF